MGNKSYCTVKMLKKRLSLSQIEIIARNKSSESIVKRDVDN